MSPLLTPECWCINSPGLKAGSVPICSRHTQEDLMHPTIILSLGVFRVKLSFAENYGKGILFYRKDGKGFVDIIKVLNQLAFGQVRESLSWLCLI